jgi:hypothetical protein
MISSGGPKHAVGAHDMKHFINQFSATASHPLKESDSIPEDYDVSHLDYQWIDSATRKDVKEISDLLKVLRYRYSTWGGD